MTISDRVAVKALAISTLNTDFAAQTSNPDLSTVKAFWDHTGTDTTDEYVVIGDITGTVEPEAFGQVGTKDDYSIACQIFTTGHATAQAACARAQLILNQVNESLFMSAAGTYFGKSLGSRAYPGQQDGPNGADPLDCHPAAAVVDFEVRVTANPR